MTDTSPEWIMTSGTRLVTVVVLTFHMAYSVVAYELPYLSPIYVLATPSVKQCPCQFTINLLIINICCRATCSLQGSQ